MAEINSITPASPPPGTIVPADAAGIHIAASLLRQGLLVGMPTETVYGLAADASNGLAIAAVYEAKGRPQFNPLISHVADLAEAQRHGVFNCDAIRLAEAFWPGPLTLVVPHRPTSPICDLARAGLGTVALRVPGSPVARALISAFGGPLAAPSANMSGRISPTRAADVRSDLGMKVALILDGGPCEVGVESTVVACLDGPPVLLRPGGVARESLEQVAGTRLGVAESRDAPAAPGMLLSHYAPLAPMQLNMIKHPPGSAILAYGPLSEYNFTADQPVFNLSPERDLRQAAATLFKALRQLDALSPPLISVMPIPRTGLGEAINDRLEKAAAPRPAHGLR